MPDPDFLPSEIKQGQKTGGEKYFCPTFVAINFATLKIILFVKRYKNFFWPIVKELKYFFKPQKLLLSSEIWVWIRGKLIPASKKEAPDPESATLQNLLANKDDRTHSHLIRISTKKPK